MEKTNKKSNIFAHIVAMSRKKKSYPHYVSIKRKRIEQQLKELHINGKYCVIAQNFPWSLYYLLVFTKL